MAYKGSSHNDSVPRVPLSVGVPVYNGATYLEESLESLLSQSFDDFEVLISDNASTDDTEEICRTYADQDERIRFVRQQKNMGGAWNFNVVAEKATAPFFKWVAHDDIMLAGFLQVCMDAFAAASSDVILCYPTSYLIDASSNIVEPWNNDLDLRQQSPHERLRAFLDRYEYSNPIFGVIRTGMLRRTNMLQPYSSADRVLIAEMAMLGQFWELDERLFLRRFHEDMSRTANKTAKELAEWFDPTNPIPVYMERSKIFYEYSRSILSSRLGLSTSERLRCMSQLVASGGLHEFRVMIGEIRRKTSDRVV